jgi:hypothetical protein
MKRHMMPEGSLNRYPLAELTTIRTTKHMGLYTTEELLLMTEVIENLKRVKRQRLHDEAQERKIARKLRNKKVEV